MTAIAGHPLLPLRGVTVTRPASGDQTDYRLRMSKQGAADFGRYLAKWVDRSDRFPHATALALAADINPGTVSRWINGKERPSPRLLEKLSAVMGVDAAELFAVAYPEIAGGESTPAEPLPRVLQQIMTALATPGVPKEAKEHLLGAVQSAFDLWMVMYKLRAPKEPSANDRTTGRDHSVTGR